MIFGCFVSFVEILQNTRKHIAKHPQNTTKHPQNTTKHHKTPQNTFAITKQPEFANKPALAPTRWGHLVKNMTAGS